MRDTIFENVSWPQMQALLEGIQMPQEAAQAMEDAWQKPLPEHAARWRRLLLHPDTAQDAANELHAWAEANGGWAAELIVHLTASLNAQRGLYLEKGIPDAIFLDTMACYSRFVAEHHVTFGAYGFDRGSWAWRQLCGLLFRLGCLEFEMTAFSREFPEEELFPDTPVLSVHIPSDAALRRETVMDSYRQARAFFKKYFPVFLYRAAYCGSWLLAPALDALLPPHSGIRAFRQDYRIIQSDPEDRSYLQWVFKLASGVTQADPALLPGHTSLQRALKQRLLEGGGLGSGLALLEVDGQPFAAR